MFTQFVVVFIAVILAKVVVVACKRLFSSPRGESRLPFLFATPIMALEADLGQVFHDVQNRLNKDLRTDAFPLKFDIGYHRWASTEEVMEVVPALLERAGWVVSKTKECDETEIMLDIPRKKFL